MPAQVEPLTARPVRTTVVCVLTAIVVAVGSVVVGVLLQRSEAGTAFHTSDQVAIIVLGLLIAAGILAFARPRVDADTERVVVRNVVRTHRLPWAVVEGVVFPDGAPCVTLQLHDDETVTVLAVQAVDGDRAALAFARLRALHAAAVGGGPPAE